MKRSVTTALIASMLAAGFVIGRASAPDEPPSPYRVLGRDVSNAGALIAAADARFEAEAAGDYRYPD